MTEAKPLTMRGSVPGKDKIYFSCEISGYRREVDANCALPRYYAVSSGNLLPLLAA